MRKSKIYIGTSGWHYDHWKGPFYPKKCTDLLGQYLQTFSTVEINRTFYSLPDKKVFLGYAKRAPQRFLFAVKASRFITHIKRLKNVKGPLKKFFFRIEGLGKYLGPILFQMPPRWKINLPRLEAFLKLLPKKHRYAFEFRDVSWLNESTYKLLQKYGAAFCIYEFGDIKTKPIITAPFIYVRLHGPDGEYAGNYSHAKLKKWAAFFRKQAKQGKDIYCYFDNDEAGYAPKNAKTLRGILRKSPTRLLLGG